MPTHPHFSALAFFRLEGAFVFNAMNYLFHSEVCVYIICRRFCYSLAHYVIIHYEYKLLLLLMRNIFRGILCKFSQLSVFAIRTINKYQMRHHFAVSYVLLLSISPLLYFLSFRRSLLFFMSFSLLMAGTFFLS